ncbi:hypothetical protein ABZX95_16960 [Streptomyces sp. NPDC004232]|uniref:hypothetical protein n=1 Tax=Streptomyces sp. NPDC004232 TaxID=3154454 RepID=UPI0033BEE48C
MTEPSRRAPRSALAGVALWTVIGLLLLTAAFVAFALSAVESANHRLQQQQEAQGTTISQQGTVITKLASGLDTTRQQLKQHHVTPKAPAASSIVQGVQGVPGVPGPAGPSGSPGATGSPGPAGASGAPGSNGRNGSPGATGAQGSPGPSGQPGSSGAPGVAGQTGATGAQGPAGPQGPQGDTGPQGPKGDTGATGPAPSSWTFTYPPGALGVTYTCTPDSPGSTNYNCTPASGSTALLKKNGGAAKNAVALVGLLATAAYRRLDPTGRRAD